MGDATASEPLPPGDRAQAERSADPLSIDRDDFPRDATTPPQVDVELNLPEPGKRTED